jgi:two-component system chemotaxis response regulator CheB
MPLASSAAPRAGSVAPYRAMVVDDSGTIRSLITRTLQADPEIAVVGAAPNGSVAIGVLRQSRAEVVVLDIEMPVMDGLTALPRLLEVDPAVKVIVASTLTRRNAAISIRALAAGATDYLLKPEASELASSAQFGRDLVQKIKALGAAARSSRRKPLGEAGTKAAAAPIALRPAPVGEPQILAIGSSTGGPQAVFKLLGDIKGAVAQPILITQHMPATFTALFAEHIRRLTGLAAAEAVDGEPVLPGRIYVAPGNSHMMVEPRDGKRVVLRLTDDPPVNYCRPAVDPMLRSLAAVYGRGVLCAMLTGMGQDGLEGARAVIAAGGSVIAQDEATSVVWGMPGAVAKAGLCSAVLPLAELGGYIRSTGRKGS